MVRSLIQFINKSPTCYHAISNLTSMLKDEGYQQLLPGNWEIQPGGKYYTVTGDATLIAFRIPSERPTGLMISASHSDSPGFRIREKAVLSGDLTRLSVERYGGMLASTWFDRPLSIAGRIMIRNGEVLTRKLIDFQKDACLIPSVAPHLDKEAANGKKLDPAVDFFPLYGNGEANFSEDLAILADCAAEDILGTDLYVYNHQPAFQWGPDGEFLSAPRLDDLACAFTCTEGFLLSHETTAIPLLCVFHNEEIGSQTRQGADSAVLRDVLSSICQGLGLSEGDLRRMLGESIMLSCDNGHGKHPNHPELADQNEAPGLGKGIVIKHSPRYATDSVSSAIFSEMCNRADVPVQHYSNRPDQPGGGTLGLMAASWAPMLCVDTGMAQLAMHSAMETLATIDVEHFIRAVTAFYSVRLRSEEDTIRIY